MDYILSWIGHRLPFVREVENCEFYKKSEGRGRAKTNRSLSYQERDRDKD